METLARLAGIASFAAFAAFFANVASGALLRASFLSDMTEMLLLCAASALFVVLILIREKLAGKGDSVTGEQ